MLVQLSDLLLIVLKFLPLFLFGLPELVLVGPEPSELIILVLNKAYFERSVLLLLTDKLVAVSLIYAGKRDC